MKEEYTAYAAPGTVEQRRRARARKRRLALCAGGALLVLLVSGILLLNAFNDRRAAEAEAAADDSPTIVLETLPAEDVTGLRFAGTDGKELRFEKTAEGVWTLAEDPTCPVDSAAVQSISDTLAGLKAYESFQPEESLAGYGLAAPAQTVTMTDAAGSTCTLKLGMQNSTTERYYLAVSGSDAVYTVAGTLNTACNVRLTDLMEKEPLPGFTSNNITCVTVEKTDAEPLVLTLTGEQQDGVDLWQAAQGEETAQVDAATGVTIMDRLASLSYNSIAAWKPDADALENYGLSEAQRKAITVAYTVTDGNGVSVSDSLTLYVGNVAEAGHYAQAQGHDAVYLITSAKVEGLLTAVPADLAPSEETE